MQNSKTVRNNKVFFYLIFLYILASFGWWSVLFLRQNQRAFQEDIAQLRSEWTLSGQDPQGLAQSPEYRTRQAELRRRNAMVAGEGLVFLTLISIGFWRIHRSFRQEIELTRQQNNFLLAITHELKSPLASIRLAMETLQKRELSPEQIKRISGLCLEDSERLERMVENILLASRIEDPRHRFERNPFDLSQLVRDTVEGLQRRFPANTVHTDIESGLSLNGDAWAITALLQNLLDNALKYSPPGSPVELALSATPQGIALVVQDRGPGIPDEEKPRIFRRFYRIGNEETRSSKGTGLGLFIAQEIVRAHGGRIEVTDRPGGGAIFTVLLGQEQPQRAPEVVPA
jgi:signal transduction histidine kinase